MELKREVRRYRRNGIVSAKELGFPERAYELMLEGVPPTIVEEMRAQILEKMTRQQEERRRRLRTQDLD
jgi:hypothetical protein